MQHSGQRNATGCHTTSSKVHLRIETKTLPTRNCFDLLCKKYLNNVLSPTNPSNPIVTRNSGSRSKHFILQSRYLDFVRPFLPAIPATIQQTRSIHKHIRSMPVQEAIRNTQPCTSDRGPQINPEEEILPRAYCKALSQLRSWRCFL